ncbi:MAG: NAD-dependent epimerase/dehydratase family protein [Actinomycetota bacterium]|nr:NAD-dependent epimerase/dehydratase family protein [Actinomycetota bacterium]
MTTNPGLHVVFGTGAIGMALIEKLNRSGRSVRAVNRSGRARVPDGVDVVGGDATNTEFAKTASADAGVVYFCLNPPYTQWPTLFPPMQAAVIEGAASAGAKLVVMENLYMYAPMHGQPLTEDLPHTATTRKGSLRAQMAADLMEAHETGKVRATAGRASDYFGPRGLLSAMGERVLYPALAGKKAQVMGDPDQLHTYSYIPDIATGLAILGEHDAADGKAWHLPNAPTLTTRQFIEQVFKAAGTETGIQAMPGWMMNTVGLFNGNVRELKEMLYEFEEPFVVDDSKFEAAFGSHATPLTEAIGTTVDWFRANPKQSK